RDEPHLARRRVDGHFHAEPPELRSSAPRLGEHLRREPDRPVHGVRHGLCQWPRSASRSLRKAPNFASFLWSIATSSWWARRISLSRSWGGTSFTSTARSSRPSE